MKPARRRDASAVTALGVLSGIYSALLLMVACAPLFVTALNFHEHYELLGAQSRANDIVGDAALGIYPLKLSQDATYIQITESDSVRVELGNSLPSIDPCLLGPNSSLHKTSTGLSAVACSQLGSINAIVARPVRQNVGYTFGLTIVFAGIIAGLLTSLSVAYLLRPIGYLRRSLEAMRQGKTPEAIPRSGLAELDMLVASVNQTAVVMEEREQALQDRLTVVQEMARIVAHEVRNPLQSLELLTSLIASESDLTEREEFAGAIHREIHTLELVVQNLLNDGTSSGLWLTKADVDLGQVLSDIVTLRTPQASGKAITLYFDRPDDLSTIWLDRVLVRRAVDNLVTNAIQMTPEHGTVNLSIVPSPTHISIAVDDTGPGVSLELGNKIFERSVSGRPGGNGIGLSLVRGVAQAHGGSVTFESSGLGGARFLLSLPLQSTGRDVENTDV